MTRQRDGPAPLPAAPGRGVRRTRTPCAPPGNPAQVRAKQPPPPRQHRSNAVRIAPGAALPCDALYALLRLAARRFGLEVGKVHEIHDPPEGLP